MTRRKVCGSICRALLGGMVRNKHCHGSWVPGPILALSYVCVCVCVCVSRCLWVCVIEADSLQLRVITVGYIRSCHAVSLVRSLQCLPCSGWRFGPFLFLVPRFLSPAAFLDSERRRLVCPLLPCATRLCLRRAPP